ncbi:cell division protein FtsL [Coxiella endosymbiont of Amblyomma americanum]|uniref:cell division protein FtsL n=1 Tax=Coxiella endosymbiont of Amblyomma americanum TaxID=325775 RepID=UPI00057E353C|nr:cell division protein FtsL [Coxiella endosymbiont of Amblyomma americanum]AJC50387.1 cell division protein FtsL [Coxiella endosymbiont of Amblyomma americanum]AUJ58728.1 cell division protein FtsL [Coxiella-like endosymbiont of Amblyomma americanum]
MNTITRVFLNKHLRKLNYLSRVVQKEALIISLVIALLCSAFCVIYIKDLHRELFIQYQILQNRTLEAQVQWRKLLLEQSTLSTQFRIQKIATQRLGMKIPTEKEIIFIS